MAGNAITLGDDPRYNSGVWRTFAIPAGATSFQFTITQAELASNGPMAPGDAFEVALLNADTMQSLAGTAAGLTDTDAFLNIQQNGQVFFSPMVTIGGVSASGGMANLDDPMTVTVDLSSVQSGTEAKLYFDLLGFGNGNSNVVVNLNPTMTTVTSDHPNGSMYGGLVTFTATVGTTGGTPTGSVQFQIDGSDYGLAVPVTDGVAVLATSGLGAGQHGVVAFYTSNSPDFASSDDQTSPWEQSVASALLTISADNQAMTYGGTLPVLTATYTGLVNGDTPATFEVSPNTAPTLSTVAATSHAGSYAITVGGASDANYTITYDSGTLTINPASLTISADSKAMTYGGTLPALTATYTGLVNGDTPATFLMSPNKAPTLSTVLATSHAGKYAITAGGASDPDYTIAYVNGTLTINSALLTISADSKTMPYGGTLPLLTATYTGLVNGDTSATFAVSPNVVPTLSTVPATSDAGTYTITAGGAADPDYVISYNTGLLTINPAKLTIAADGKTMTYGGALPTLTATYTGLVNGDTPGTFAVSPNVAPRALDRGRD